MFTSKLLSSLQERGLEVFSQTNPIWMSHALLPVDSLRGGQGVAFNFVGLRSNCVNHQPTMACKSLYPKNALGATGENNVYDSAKITV